jgi:hypothetical protein
MGCTFNPIVSRAVNMIIRDERIDPPPEELEHFDIIYLGSLTRAQQVDEVAAIERTMGSAANIAEVFPEALDVIDAPEAIRMIGSKLNAPAGMMRDEKEVKVINDQRKADQARMQEAAAQQAEGDAAQSTQTAQGMVDDQTQTPA